MTHEATITSNLDRWSVEFTAFRVQNETQRQAIECLDRRSLDEVLAVWLKVITPGARVVDPPGVPIATIVFSNRAAGRHFISCFGGRWSSPRS